jgi:uracil-DNA glycosylase
VRTIHAFVRQLSLAPAPARGFNQYAASSPMSDRKRSNLRLYLSRMLASGTKTILVGEAPSYRGGRLTGVPFLSEAIMLNGVAGTDLFGPRRGFARATRLPRLSTEASATIVWGAIARLDPPPLLWNAYPFHPFRAGNPDSNRAPTREEIAIGKPFLAALLRLFAIETVVAVGNHAAATLDELGIPHEKVRHPANGGKQKFVEGLGRICQNSPS